MVGGIDGVGGDAIKGSSCGGARLKSLAAILRCRDDKEIVKINQHRYREDQKEEKRYFFSARHFYFLDGGQIGEMGSEIGSIRGSTTQQKQHTHQRQHTQERIDQREQSKTQHKVPSVF